jgi:glycosyltransferase involved in cell wall biosynthesis
MIKERKLDDFIVFYGESYNERELAPLIALADVCVSPGNVGLTAIHALTYGTPVINS